MVHSSVPGGPSTPTRVLVVDAHPVVCEAFTHIFEHVDDIDVVGTAANAHEALERCTHLRPHVVLVDLVLPDEDGTVLAQRIRARQPSVRILLFTGAIDAEQVIRARTADVDGIVLKTSAVSQVIGAIREARAGNWVLDPDLAGAAPDPHFTGPGPSLSKRELQVLTLLSKGMTNRDAAVALFVSQGTVKTHIENIFHKLGVGDRAAAVAEGFRRGLLRA